MAEPLTYFFSDPAARDFVTGVAQSCEERGQGLMLVAVGPTRSPEDGEAAVLAAGVDGFVVYSVRDDDPYLEVVLQRRVPVVVVDQPRGLSGVFRVGIDDRAAMRELADYVLGLGHREIGLLTMRLGQDRRQDLADAERLIAMAKELGPGERPPTEVTNLLWGCMIVTVVLVIVAGYTHFHASLAFTYPPGAFTQSTTNPDFVEFAAQPF